jgi:glycosyltransferase involved in cell wall biosynthesis
VRILAVFFHPGANFTAVGGAEKRFLQVLKVWNQKDVEVIVAESNPKLVSSLSSHFETIEISSPISALGKGLYSIYLEWVLWVVKACVCCPSIARRKKPDALLAPNNTLPNLLVAYFVHALSKVPLVVTVHHFDFPELDKKANVASTYRVYKKAGFSRPVAFVKALTFSTMLAIVKRSDMCITVSNYTARFLLRNGIPRDRVCVSGNGVDIDLIEQSTAERKVNDGIFVGRISREKGIFDLVHIWKVVNAMKTDSKLVVVGQGPDFPKLKGVIDSSCMSSNILLKGSCSDAELYALVKASKVFLFPSRFEGWGLAVGEALGAGLPVVCYDIPALREVFGECRSVFFTPVGDAERFAQTIVKIFEENGLAELEAVSKEFARRFNWEEVALNDLDTIETLVHQRV